MIYIPMLKMRTVEMRVVKKMNEYFSDKIIPLIEIVSDKYEVRYKVNPVTKEFVYIKEGKRRRRIKEEPQESDIITLNYLNELLGGKLLFIDYFRFTRKKYGSGIDPSKVQLALKLNNNEELYKDRIRDISRFPNMIPVISIKKEFGMSEIKLMDFLQEIQLKNERIALRLTEEWLEEYDKVIETVLRDKDYLLFDIEEQSPETKFIELEELMEKKYATQIILLNSPRKLLINNGEYPAHDVADMIDNTAREKVDEYGMDGYGDYCGHKDTLPLAGGSNGTGAALSLLYDYKSNVFYSYVNKDTSKGMHGYIPLIPLILADKFLLDPQNDCLAIMEIEKMKSSGSWTTWININLTRYIHQIYKNI